MNEADKILLDGLRLVADASDDVWALVEAEVAKAGSVRNVTGQARLEIERAVAKARTLVEKHGTHDQSAHGGKKGGGSASTPSDAPSGGGGSSGGDAPAKAKLDKIDAILAKEPAAFTTSKDIDRERAKMKTATKDQAIASAKNAHKEHRMALEMEDSRRKIAYDMQDKKSPKADAALADSKKFGTESAVQFNLAGAWTLVARSLGASDADLVVKARTLVEKHPGHADQSVHGSGKKRGVKPATKPDGIGAGSEGDRAVDQAVSLLGSADKIPSAGRADHSKASIASERKAMSTATKQQAIDRSKEHQVAFEVASAEARGYQKRAEMQNKAGNGKEAQAEYKMQDVWNKSAGISVSLASAWGSVAMALGASEASMVGENG